MTAQGEKKIEAKIGLYFQVRSQCEKKKRPMPLIYNWSIWNSFTLLILGQSA